MNDLQPVIDLVAKYSDEKPNVNTLIIAVLLNQLVREVGRVAEQLSYIDSSIENINRN